MEELLQLCSKLSSVIQECHNFAETVNMNMFLI